MIKMLTGEVGIDPVLVIPEARAAKRYKELLPLLGQLQAFKQGSLETSLGEDEEHSIAESLRTGIGSATDSGSASDDGNGNRGDQEQVAREVASSTSSRSATPEPLALPEALRTVVTPAVQRLTSQFEKLSEMEPEGSRQRGKCLEDGNGFRKVDCIGAESGARKKHLNQPSPRFKSGLLKDELNKLPLKINPNPLKVEAGGCLVEGRRTPEARGHKRKEMTNEHPGHFPPGLEELAPKLRPIPEGARRISNMSGLGVYHWIGSPWEISGDALMVFTNQNLKIRNNKFRKELMEKAGMEYWEETRDQLSLRRNEPWAPGKIVVTSGAQLCYYAVIHLPIYQYPGPAGLQGYQAEMLTTLERGLAKAGGLGCRRVVICVDGLRFNDLPWEEAEKAATAVLRLQMLMPTLHLARMEIVIRFRHILLASR